MYLSYRYCTLKKSKIIHDFGKFLNAACPGFLGEGVNFHVFWWVLVSVNSINQCFKIFKSMPKPQKRYAHALIEFHFEDTQTIA